MLDRHLFTNEWVAADRITTADFSCVGYLYYDHEFGHDLTAYPEHRALAPGDRRTARLEAPLRPDAGPPDPGRGADVTEPAVTGGCQCGRVRYAVTGGLGRANLCHCRMCQRATGNAFAPLVTASRVVFEGAAARFASSDAADAASAVTAARRSSTPPRAATTSS